MTILAIIAARARNGVIGRDNALPWHLPEDLRRFRELTMGKPVIMGRRTWESLPAKFRPLPGRQNIVVSRNPAWAADGATPARSVEAALAPADGADEAFVIGGAELYRQSIGRAERLYLTEIELDVAGDAHFPEIVREHWQEVAREPRQSADGLDFAFVRLDRRDPIGT